MLVHAGSPRALGVGFSGETLEEERLSYLRTTAPRGRSSALKIDVVTVLVLEMFAAFFGLGMYLAYQL